MGLGTTGLTFFDDEVTRFFEPAASGHQVMYLAAIGERGTRSARPVAWRDSNPEPRTSLPIRRRNRGLPRLPGPLDCRSSANRPKLHDTPPWVDGYGLGLVPCGALARAEGGGIGAGPRPQSHPDMPRPAGLLHRFGAPGTSPGQVSRRLVVMSGRRLPRVEGGEEYGQDGVCVWLPANPCARAMAELADRAK